MKQTDTNHDKHKLQTRLTDVMYVQMDNQTYRQTCGKSVRKTNIPLLHSPVDK